MYNDCMKTGESNWSVHATVRLREKQNIFVNTPVWNYSVLLKCINFCSGEELAVAECIHY